MSVKMRVRPLLSLRSRIVMPASHRAGSRRRNRVTLGGAFGLLLACWFKDGLLAVSDWGGQQMSALEARLDLRVLVFTVALSWAAGILFGLAPAWRATKVDLAPALKDNFRSSSSSPRSLFTKALIVA